MKIFYDARDIDSRSSHVRWLIECGARPLHQAASNDEGFLFAGYRGMPDYTRLVSPYPKLRDLPEDRAPLCNIDTVLDAMAAARLEIPTPKTWRLPLDAPLPHDLTFPLFVRTAATSWKLGGRISRVRNIRQLREESEALRRAFGWDSLIIARQWLELAPAGHGMYGPIPQEIRVWNIDATPRAWSFHYLNILKNPRGFPPGEDDLRQIFKWSKLLAGVFRSKLVVADFTRFKKGGWAFIEAGPGSCAGTAHEKVYKAVLSMLANQAIEEFSDDVGGVCREW